MRKVFLLVFSFFILVSSVTFASDIGIGTLEGVGPEPLPGLDTIANNVIGVMQWIAYIATIVVIMLMGIKYFQTGGAAEKADVKAMFFPLIFGIAIVITATSVAGQFLGDANITITPDSSATGSFQKGTNIALSAIKWVGYATCVLMVASAGIKYISGGVDEKAGMKQTLYPILIGAICIAIAVNVADFMFSGSGIGG